MNYPYKKGWWETKDHKKIKIEDMETSHIENTIKYLKRNNNFYDETYFVGWTGDGDGDGQIYDYIEYNTRHKGGSYLKNFSFNILEVKKINQN